MLYELICDNCGRKIENDEIESNRDLTEEEIREE